MNLEFQIPDEVAHLLAAEYADLPRAAIEALALEGYRSRHLSDGQVRQMLGFSSRMQKCDAITVPVFAKIQDIGVN